MVNYLMILKYENLMNEHLIIVLRLGLMYLRTGFYIYIFLTRIITN